jgi:hypothetical protein
MMDISPRGVAQQSADLTAQLGELVRELGEADLKATRARVEFLKRYAIAWQQVSGSEQTRRQVAIRVTIGWRLEAEEATCEVRRLNREIDHLELRVGVSRSLGAAVRAEAQALGPWTEG